MRIDWVMGGPPIDCDQCHQPQMLPTQFAIFEPGETPCHHNRVQVCLGCAMDMVGRTLTVALTWQAMIAKAARVKDRDDFIKKFVLEPQISLAPEDWEPPESDSTSGGFTPRTQVTEIGPATFDEKIPLGAGAYKDVFDSSKYPSEIVDTSCEICHKRIAVVKIRWKDTGELKWVCGDCELEDKNKG
jgi:hypothetical protein